MSSEVNMDNTVYFSYLIMLSKHFPWSLPMPHQRIRYAERNLRLSLMLEHDLNIETEIAEWIKQWATKSS